MKRLLATRWITALAIGTIVVAAAGGGYALASARTNIITVCVSKHGGTLYKSRRCKRHDSRLSWNKVGPRGPAGPRGATGAPGAPGATGSPGVVSIGGWSGRVRTIPANDTFVFAGPTTKVTTAAGQSIAASGSAALATKVATTFTASVAVCIQPAAGGALSLLDNNTNGAFTDVTITNDTLSYAASATGSPGAGTFNVGVCVRDESTSQEIDNADFSVGYAFVVNGTVTSETVMSAVREAPPKSH
jgi:hypothetical protein